MERVIRGSSTVVKKYFERDAISQSNLKKLIQGVDYYLDNANKDLSKNKSVIIGKAVDTLVTGTIKDFNEEFYVSTLANKPSDLECSIMQELKFAAQRLGVVTCYDDLTPDLILEVIEKFNWQPKWGPDAKLKNIAKASLYFNELLLSEGKTILTVEDKITIDTVVKSLLENERLQDIFACEEALENASNETYDYQLFYQFPIYFVCSGKVCKGLLDILGIKTHKVTGKVVQVFPVDLKTMSGFTVDFPRSFESFRYDIQAAFYTEGLRQVFPEAKVKPFRFVVESITNPGKPLIFSCSDEVLDGGEFGYKKYNRHIPGFKQLIEEHIYQEETGWKEDRFVTEAGGVLELGYNGIIK